MWRRSVMISVVALLLAVVSVDTAKAHSKLVASDPGDGAVLTQAPQHVTLTFDEELVPSLANVAIIDAQGTVVSTANVEPQGARIQAPWPVAGGQGTYQVSYRVVSADGHPVMGAVTFTIAASSTAAPIPSVATFASATPVAPSAADDSKWWLPVGLVLGLAIVVVSAVWGSTRVRRRRS